MVVFRIRVALLDIEPPIWRSIELSSQTTLKQLHRILQIAMGWEDYHLHVFEGDGKRYGVPEPEDDESDIVIPECRVRLGEVLPTPGAWMLYTYDYGDGWRHEILVESVEQPEPNVEYPRVVAGARHCPPEDCGGPPGYANLVEVLMDPTHEDYVDMRQWAGDDFYAELFSLDAVNKRLRRNRSLVAKV